MKSASRTVILSSNFEEKASKVVQQPDQIFGLHSLKIASPAVLHTCPNQTHIPQLRSFVRILSCHECTPGFCLRILVPTLARRARSWRPLRGAAELGQLCRSQTSV